MRIAFYAPMKPPTASTPSGDREMARQLFDALALAGHEVELASAFRSWDGAGDRQRQARIATLGAGLADRLARRYRSRPRASRPGAWFTYHLYHKAPDWIGPAVADALDIPYIVAEPSFAPKQAGGKWAAGHDAAAAAIRRAEILVSLNSNDRTCVLPLLENPARLRALRPFTDIAPLAAAAEARAAHRAALADEFDLDPGIPVLLAVAMMRDGDKLASYRLLGEALGLLDDAPWQLVVVGDGDRRAEIEDMLAPTGGRRVRFAGLRSRDALPGIYAAADLLVWPAIREAYGMALLEAQAAGLPVVAGDSGGVGDIVRHGTTGLLAPEGDARAFADAIRSLLDDAPRRAAMGAEAREVSARDHSVAAAASRLDAMIAEFEAVPAK